MQIPFLSLKNFSIQDLNKLFEMVYTCIIQSYEFGGGELINWSNPIYKSRQMSGFVFMVEKRYALGKSLEREMFG